MEAIDKSRSQALVDLKWAMGTPSLISGPDVVPPLELDENLIDVEDLEAFIAERAGHRVGRYFESLILYWLTRIERVELVADGLQIMDGKRTVGELDFLFRDHDGTLHHWEAAVKFFLHYPREGKSHFPGPNARDNFERKTTRLFDTQLQLSVEHYPEVQVRRAFVRGQIFSRLGHAEPAELPTRMSGNHLRGKWLPRSALAQLQNRYASCLGHVVMKPLWLAPVLNAPVVPLPELYTQLCVHFENSVQPVMISLRTADTIEVERLFVVSDHWPSI